MRIDPPPSVAVATPTRPAMRAAAEPPLEPPGERSVFQGLRVTPVKRLAVYPSMANSGRVDLPTTTAPASRRRWGTTPLDVAGATSRNAIDPLRVG